MLQGFAERKNAVFGTGAGDLREMLRCESGGAQARVELRPDADPAETARALAAATCAEELMRTTVAGTSIARAQLPCSRSLPRRGPTILDVAAAAANRECFSFALLFLHVPVTSETVKQAIAGLDLELVRDCWTRLPANERDIVGFASVAAGFANEPALGWLLGMATDAERAKLLSHSIEWRLPELLLALAESGFDVGRARPEGAMHAWPDFERLVSLRRIDTWLIAVFRDKQSSTIPKPPAAPAGFVEWALRLRGDCAVSRDAGGRVEHTRTAQGLAKFVRARQQAGREFAYVWQLLARFAPIHQGYPNEACLAYVLRRPDARICSGRASLSNMALVGSPTEVADMLRSFPRGRSAAGQEALECAARAGVPSVLQLLIDAGVADINATCDIWHRRSALHFAARVCGECTRILLRAGARVDG
jgi:hypothetical protein